MKRIKKITLNHFRGFNGEFIFDFNADLILLAGKNGVGKSSIIYALDRILNGYSKNGFLSHIGNVITSGSERGYIKVIYDDDKSDIIELNKFNQPGDDKYALLYELSTVFYQEFLNEIGVSDVVKLMSGDLVSIQMKKHLTDFEKKVIPTLKQKYLPSSIDVEKRRSAFLTSWKQLVEELKDNEGFKDIKQNFIFPRKGIPKYLENQFKNFTEYLEQKYKIKGGERDENLNFINVLKRLANVLQEIINKESSKNETNNFYKKIVDFKSYKLSIWKENIEIIKNTIFYGSPSILAKKKQNFEKQVNEINKDIDKIEKGISFWEIPGRNPFEEVISDIKLYIEKLSYIKNNEFYYPTEVALSLGKIKNDVYKIDKAYKLWLDKIKKEKNALEDKKNKILEQIEVLKNSITFSQFIKDEGLDNVSELITTEEHITIDELFKKIKFPMPETNFIGKKSVQQIFKNMYEILLQQIENERHIYEERKIRQYRMKHIDDKEKIINCVEKIIRNEKGKNSILQSCTQQIPAESLKNLEKALNSILYFFHFSIDFLPLRIINMGTKAKPNYSIVTKQGKDISYSSLSTGQKSQIAIAWLIGLNYWLCKKIPHRVIMFDDITTSLDLSQLIPASILFRKMAYSNDKDKKEYSRQVILSSHHDDLTNRFIDFLMPPPGKKMKVFYFEEWTLKKGPQYEEFVVDNTNSREKDINNFYKKKKEQLINYYIGGPK